MNPGGRACYGWVVYRGDMQIASDCGQICSGESASNNVAEYGALRSALKYLVTYAYNNEEVEVRSDSNLIVQQLKGSYQVSAPRIFSLYHEVKELASLFLKISYTWIPRSENVEADALAQKAYNYRAKAEA